MGKLKLFIFCLILIILVVIPDIVLGALHALLEMIIEGAHVLFEIAEVFLDKVIEHTFHTELHTTQIIVFYILIAGIFFLLKAIWGKLRRVVPRYIQECKDTFGSTKALYKVQVEDRWQDLMFFQKMKMYAVGVSLVVGLIFLLM